jgi:hypothetical protein
MVVRFRSIILCLIFFLVSLASCTDVRAQYDCAEAYNINKVLLYSYGGGSIVGWPGYWDKWIYYECYQGEYFSKPRSQYPKGTKIEWGRASFIVAGILNRDTVVSSGAVQTIAGLDFTRSEPPIYRTLLDPGSPGYHDAVSEQDIIATAEDTTKRDPLYVKITRKSYAWSYQYAEDFILFDAEFENIGNQTIERACLGIDYRPTIGLFHGDSGSNFSSTIGGFRTEVQNPRCGAITDTAAYAWFANRDGQPIDGAFRDYEVQLPNGFWQRSCPNVAAFLILAYPPGRLENRAHLSCNWYRGSPDWPEGGNFIGPIRKDHRYFYEYSDQYGYLDPQFIYETMSNGEIDYDILRTNSIQPTDPVWRYPWPPAATRVSTYGDICYHILSIGPYDLAPGQSIHLPFALVFGEHFHTRPDLQNFLPDNINTYYRYVDFSDLEKNIGWAKMIYDNPGVDTDGDGYAGEMAICDLDSVYTDNGWIVTVADTFYTTGDGVPDWRTVMPPPAPTLRLEPLVGGIRIHFNGYYSETAKDIFSGIIDFEGYSVYVGRDERDQSLSLVASYDNVDFDTFVYDASSGHFLAQGIPLPLDSLRCRYGRTDDPCMDSTFDPLAYSAPTKPYTDPRHPGRLLNFRKNAYNVHVYPAETSIHKTYPDALDPRGVLPQDLTPDYYTEDGHFKFFEYACEVHGLLTSVQYSVAVTAFDFGMPGTTIKPLESAKSANVTSCFIYANEGEESGSDKEIYVYPNPYRAKDNYRGRGYEGRTRQDRPDYRTRALNFGNLPPRCTISIYSLDGDLIRKIDHDYSPTDPNCHHDYWDMITRNTEAPVSGLYYWVVEIPGGKTQMGKFVIIM